MRALLHFGSPKPVWTLDRVILCSVRSEVEGRAVPLAEALCAGRPLFHSLVAAEQKSSNSLGNPDERLKRMVKLVSSCN